MIANSHLILLADQTLKPVTGLGNYLPTSTNDTGAPEIERLFSTIFGFLTIVAGLSFLVYFLIGALNWVTAGPDEKKVEDAKKYMTNGVIGMIVVVAAYSVISIVGTVLGLDILNPAATLNSIFTPFIPNSVLH